MLSTHDVHRHNGFGIVEVVLSLALFLIIMSSILQYISSIRRVDDSSKTAYWADMTFGYGQQACEFVGDTTIGSQSHIQLQFLSTSTVITSVNSVDHNTFIITTDSASTSEADIFKIRIENNEIEVLDMKDVGPGIQDGLLLYPYLYVANTSINSHIKVLNISVDISELQSIRIDSLNQSGSMPRNISVFGRSIILGTEKNSVGPELFMFEISATGTLAYAGPAFELGGQAHTSRAVGERLLTANSADPELRIFDSTLSLYTSYDAPFTLGNGKAVLGMYQYVVLGRTIGSEELTSLHMVGTSTEVLDTARTYGTVDDLVHVDEYMFLVFTANQYEEMQFWNIDLKGMLKKIHTTDLPGRMSAYICTEGSIHIYTSAPQVYPSLAIINNNP